MFRFTIRDVLWLTVVVAVATCWQLDRRRIDELADRVAAIESQAAATNAATKTANRKLDRLEAKNRQLDSALRRVRRYVGHQQHLIVHDLILRVNKGECV